MGEVRKANLLLSNKPARTTPKTNRIEKQMLREIKKAHRDFFKQVFEILPIRAKYENVRSAIDAESNEYHTTRCGCNSCNEIQSRKYYTDPQITAIINEFASEIGLAESLQIDMAAKAWIESVIGTNGFPAADTPYKKGLWEIIKETYVWANGKIQQAFNRLPSFLQNEIGADALQVIQVEANTPFVANLYNEGFQLVTDKITKQFVPEINQYMTQQIEAGQDWQSIARGLKNKFGEGAQWQWDRIVRTEMSRAIDQATMAAYEEAGVGYVKWSVAPGGCPECTAIASENYGYYALGSVPSVPVHPNCRCTKIAVWRLPKGVEVD